MPCTALTNIFELSFYFVRFTKSIIFNDELCFYFGFVSFKCNACCLLHVLLF